jgi:hypothetical protein
VAQYFSVISKLQKRSHRGDTLDECWRNRQEKVKRGGDFRDGEIDTRWGRKEVGLFVERVGGGISGTMASKILKRR